MTRDNPYARFLEETQSPVAQTHWEGCWKEHHRCAIAEAARCFYPREPAAFINTIHEEGTKEDAVRFLQQTWNELCEVKAELVAMKRKKNG